MQHPTSDGIYTNIKDKKVCWCLGCPDHIFTGCHPFHDTLAQFRTLFGISSLIPFVQMTKVGTCRFIQLGADVASPSPSILQIGDEGIDARFILQLQSFISSPILIKFQIRDQG
eukprot:278523_1